STPRCRTTSATPTPCAPTPTSGCRRSTSGRPRWRAASTSPRATTSSPPGRRASTLTSSCPSTCTNDESPGQPPKGHGMTVLDLLGERFGLEGVEISALGGEVDRNSAVVLDDGSRVVVKVSARDVSRIEWEHGLVRLAGGELGTVRVPAVRTALDGESVVVTG